MGSVCELKATRISVKGEVTSLGQKGVLQWTEHLGFREAGGRRGSQVREEHRQRPG